MDHYFYIIPLISILLFTSRSTAICPPSCKCIEPAPQIQFQKHVADIDDYSDFPADQSTEYQPMHNSIDSNNINDPHLIAADCTAANLTTFPILLNPRTRRLILAKNKIASLSLDELSVYPDLEYLDLSNNKIFSIEQGAFFRLQKLKVLKLAENSMTSLAIETFAGLSELKTLDLSSNMLSRLATSIFR